MTMTVAEWLNEHPGHILVVQEDAMLEETLALFKRYPDAQDIYVNDVKGCVVGHISKLRIASIVLAEHSQTHSHRQLIEQVASGNARELMGRHFPTARLDEALDDVIHRQLEHQLHDMAVLDAEGRLAGTISLTCLLQSFI